MIQWFSFRLCVPFATSDHKVSRVGSDYCYDDHDDADYDDNYTYDFDDADYNDNYNDDFGDGKKLTQTQPLCEQLSTPHQEQ